MDNIFIERLWRSLKWEDIYLKDYQNLVELEEGLDRWMSCYNHRRIHQTLNCQRPWERYRSDSELAEAA